MMRTLRDLLSFFQRDLRIASTYRSPFILEVIEALFGVAMFYYVARFVDSPELRQALPQGNTYFAYSLVGFVFFDYLNAALDSFDRSLLEARDTGTLEPLAGYAGLSAGNSGRVRGLSLRGHGVAHRRISRLGRDPFPFSAWEGQTGSE